jgi:chloride channel protein, CIC family
MDTRIPASQSSPPPPHRPTDPHPARPLRRARSWLPDSITDNHFLIILSVLVGLGGGLGAVAFRWLINQFQQLFMVEGRQLLGHPYLLPLIPAAGMLIVAFIVLRWAREARGHGVPEVMAAVATKDGRIRPRVAIVKSLASAICIGSGGSVGREGPIVQIGSALGSSLGQLCGIDGRHLRILVGCGAAAGISGTFNAPIAGALFALEVILGDFTITAFSPIVISSVLATALTRFMLGNEPAFLVPSYQMVSPYELLYYLALGALGAVAAVGFTRFLYRMEDLFDAMKIPEHLKAVGGGLAVGITGLFLPQVFGVGYETITDALHNNIGLTLFGVLLVAKFLATSVTLAAGGSGGIFAPSLFMGAMLGGAFGMAVNALTPGLTAAPGAYALVGMGVFVAGTTHAPLTAILILFELTDDYRIILPLMLATTVAALVARWVFCESIYTLKLSRRGLSISNGIDVSVLETLRVRDIINSDYMAVHADASLGRLVQLLRSSEQTDFPVVDEDRKLCGTVLFQDLRAVMGDRDLYDVLLVTDFMQPTAPCIELDRSLLVAYRLFSRSDIHDLPVVASASDRRLLGTVTRCAVTERYDQVVHRRMEVSADKSAAPIPLAPAPVLADPAAPPAAGGRSKLGAWWRRRMAGPELVHAATGGQLYAVTEMLSEGNDPDQRDTDGNTPLTAAALQGDVRIVNRLKAAGADLEAANKWGWTALMAAALRGHAHVARVLLAAGAEPNMRDHTGATPLHRATSKGFMDVVAVLLEGGARPDLADRRGTVPLLMAVNGDYETILRLLIRAGAGVQRADQAGVTPLMRAAQRGHVTMVDALLDAGADSNIEDAQGNTPLHAAADQGCVEIVELLLDADANPQARDDHGRSPLLRAERKGHADVVQLLAATGRVNAVIGVG